MGIVVGCNRMSDEEGYREFYKVAWRALGMIRRCDRGDIGRFMATARRALLMVVRWIEDNYQPS